MKFVTISILIRYREDEKRKKDLSDLVTKC